MWAEKIPAAELAVHIELKMLELQDLRLGAAMERLRALRELAEVEAAASLPPMKPIRAFAARGAPTQERIAEAERERRAG